ncbi:hypothetical protein SB18R_03250 [Pseudomonas oryzihabitans]|nr:hypothetical protein SB9_12485 [Pseudomonas psychrotolerans]KTT78260.1 hypothetical protein SB18R_03250 [Pseudomonas psychrotolerans]
MASNYSGTTQSLLAMASQAMTEASNQARRIGVAPRPSLKEATFDHQVPDIHLDPPAQFADLFTGSNNADPNIQAINAQVDSWTAKYFPAIASNMKSVPEDWLVAVIGGTTPYGQDKTAFELVWQRARDRAYRTARSEQRTLEANVSARGFTLPPGVLAQALLDSEQRASEAALEVNREQAIKEAEIKQDLLKFAVQLASNMKLGILQSCADYFRAYTQLYTLDSDAARSKAQAYGAFYGALSSYYGVEVSLEQLKLESAKIKADVSNNIDRNRVALQGIQTGSDALGQATRAFGDIAAQAASSAGTLAVETQSL